MKELAIEPHIRINAHNRNERVIEIDVILIIRAPINAIKTGMMRENIPKYLFIRFSATKAPLTPVQLLISCLWLIRSIKDLFTTLLWSAAPVKKRDIIPNSMNAEIKIMQTPNKKCPLSLLVYCMKDFNLLLFFFLAFFFFAIAEANYSVIIIYKVNSFWGFIIILLHR